MGWCSICPLVLTCLPSPSVLYSGSISLLSITCVILYGQTTSLCIHLLMVTCFYLLAVVNSSVRTWMCKCLFQNFLWFFFLFIYSEKGFLDRNGRLNIWAGISLGYLVCLELVTINDPPCLSFLSTWDRRHATVPGSSWVLWGTSNTLFIVVSFCIPPTMHSNTYSVHH